MENFIVYVAFPEFKHLLLQELDNITKVDENLIFSTDKRQNCCFAEDIWLNPQLAHFNSINEAAQLLLRIQKHWYLYPLRLIRRGKLIESKLKNPFTKNLQFPCDNNFPNTGVFCLLDNNTLLFSAQRWKKIPFGLVNFAEDKINPPNRAYLKLWESFCFLNCYPRPGETAIDLGASPGGWSYVLANLGANVIAVDKAPLTAALMHHPAIEFRQQSAFSLTPETLPHVEWLCADIACYPARLYQFILQWIDAKKATHIICTIKFQGETDRDIIKKFQAIPGGMVIHLFYNKHEATFLYPVADCLFPFR